MKPADVFLRIMRTLDESGIAYMLPGSLAGAFYGALRTTQDIDTVPGWTIEFMIRKSRAFSEEEFRRGERVSIFLGAKVNL